MNRIRRFEITNDDENTLLVYVERKDEERTYHPTNASTERINDYLEYHCPEVRFETYEDQGHQEQYIWIRLK